MNAPRTDGFAADLDAAADAGLSIDAFSYLTTQFDPGQFADFMALDPAMQCFVLRVLGGLAAIDDYDWFYEQDGASAVAAWMLELPAFRRADAYGGP